MANTPPDIFPSEPEDEALDRLITDFSSTFAGGAVFNSRPGSTIHAIFQTIAQDSVKAYDLGQFAIGLGFLSFSEGAYLDAKALEFGVERSAPIAATTTLTFIGDVGTLIPAGTSVSTEGNQQTGDEGISFFTVGDVIIDLDGEVTVTATAELAGAIGNVAAGDINVLETPIEGIADVYNEQASLGGVDTESDEVFREKVLAKARSLPRSGNVETLYVLALSDPEVGTAYVKDFWFTYDGSDGNGTALVVVGGIAVPYVTATGVDRIQTLLDPTVKLLISFEESGIIGTDFTLNSSTPLEGAASAILDTGVGTPANVIVPKVLDLSAWDNPLDEIRIFTRRYTASTTIGSVVVRLISPGGVGVGYTSATISAANFNALTNVTSLGVIQLPRSAFTNTGTFSWASIGSIEVILNPAAGQSATVEVDGIRIIRKFGGFSGGLAPIHTQVTVKSVRVLSIDITANIALRAGADPVSATTEIREALIEHVARKSPGSTIYLAEIANIIYDTPNVVDYNTILINGAAANLVLAPDQRPTLNSFSPTII